MGRGRGGLRPCRRRHMVSASPLPTDSEVGPLLGVVKCPPALRDPDRSLPCPSAGTATPGQSSADQPSGPGEQGRRNRALQRVTPGSDPGGRRARVPRPCSRSGAVGDARRSDRPLRVGSRRLAYLRCRDHHRRVQVRGHRVPAGQRRGEGRRAALRVGRGPRQRGDVRGARSRHRTGAAGGGPEVPGQAVRCRLRLDHRARRVRRPRAPRRLPAGVRRRRVPLRRPQPGASS